MNSSKRMGSHSDYFRKATNIASGSKEYINDDTANNTEFSYENHREFYLRGIASLATKLAVNANSLKSEKEIIREFIMSLSNLKDNV